MKSILYLFALVRCLLFSTSAYSQKEVIAQFNTVRAQSYPYDKTLGSDKQDRQLSHEAFEISKLITYGEYKVFLKEAKETLEESDYLKLFPDSSICNFKCYQHYLKTKEFDEEPVVGITWEAATEYCKWKTQKDNSTKDLEFLYRLPTLSEWTAALYYMSDWGTYKDIDRYYSDWLFNSYDRSQYFLTKEKSTGNFPFFAKDEGYSRLKRKLAIGNSYSLKHDKLIKHLDRAYYASKGYRHISFRVVKVYKKQNKKDFKAILKLWDLD